MSGGSGFTPKKWIGFALSTFPAGVSLPFAIEWTRIGPTTEIGDWYALWCLLTSDAWPPEIDIDEVINTGTASATNSIHSTSSVWATSLPADLSDGAGSNAGTFTVGVEDGKSRRIGAVVYADKIAMFRDGVCTNTWTVPKDINSSGLWYPVIDFTKSASGWAGDDTSNILTSLTISDIGVWTLPEVYPGPPTTVSTEVVAAQTANTAATTAITSLMADIAGLSSTEAPSAATLASMTSTATSLQTDIATVNTALGVLANMANTTTQLYDEAGNLLTDEAGNPLSSP
jgi:hypothetical protein